MALESTRLTKEEISYIDKKLHYIIFDWAKTLINHIISQAQNNNVKVVYMNTPETLEAGAITEGKTEYFYEKLPLLLGFKKEKAQLRNRGVEILWAYHLDSENKDIEFTSNSFLKLFKTAKQIALKDIPKSKQGAIISIIGKKDFYTEDDIRKVLTIIEKNKENKKNKLFSKFYYDWNSKTWTGGQRFSPRVTENVVLQKMTVEMQNYINSDDILRKFWAYILNQSQHFGPDVIGFALVSKIKNDIWVINEIQTDNLNHYLELRSEVQERENINKTNKTKGISWEVLKDMLEAQNRSKWIPKIETNETFKEQLLQNPEKIQQLPDNNQDIDMWIKEHIEGQDETRLDLIRHFQSVNFNTRIFKLY